MKGKAWAVGIVLVALSGLLGASANAEEGQNKAEELLRAITLATEINSLGLSYSIDMDCQKLVSLKARVTMEMRKSKRAKSFEQKDIYDATFAMTAPKSKGPWSWVAMNVFRGYDDEEYKDMVRSLNVTVWESFSKQELFRTIGLRQIITEKNYANQTPMAMEFGPENICFWPDAENKGVTERQLPYKGQVGPLTGFFNFLLFYNSKQPFCVINFLNRVYDTGSVDQVSGLKIKQVEYLFSNQSVIVEDNMPESKAPYANLINFGSNNFLDIVSGRISFNMITAKGNSVKVPYAISVEGVFSKNKLYRQAEDIKAINARRQELSVDEFNRELAAIYDRNTLAAWNIRCYLSAFQVNGEPLIKTAKQQ